MRLAAAHAKDSIRVVGYYLSLCRVCPKTWNCWRTNWIMVAWELHWIMTEESINLLFSKWSFQKTWGRLGVLFRRHSKLHNLTWTRKKIQRREVLPPHTDTPADLIWTCWYDARMDPQTSLSDFMLHLYVSLFLSILFYCFYTAPTHRGPIMICRLCNLWNPRTSIITYSQCLWAMTSWSFHCPPGISLRPA